MSEGLPLSLVRMQEDVQASFVDSGGSGFRRVLLIVYASMLWAGCQGGRHYWSSCRLRAHPSTVTAHCASVTVARREGGRRFCLPCDTTSLYDAVVYVNGAWPDGLAVVVLRSVRGQRRRIRIGTRDQALQFSLVGGDVVAVLW